MSQIDIRRTYSGSQSPKLLIELEWDVRNLAVQVQELVRALGDSALTCRHAGCRNAMFALGLVPHMKFSTCPNVEQPSPDSRLLPPPPTGPPT